MKRFLHILLRCKVTSHPLCERQLLQAVMSSGDDSKKMARRCSFFACITLPHEVRSSSADVVISGSGGAVGHGVTVCMKRSFHNNCIA